MERSHIKNKWEKSVKNLLNVIKAYAFSKVIAGLKKSSYFHGKENCKSPNKKILEKKCDSKLDGTIPDLEKINGTNSFIENLNFSTGTKSTENLDKHDVIAVAI